MGLKSGLGELLVLFEQVRNKMMELGNIFSEIQTSHKDLEDFKRPEILKIKPALSNVYADLKTSLYSWANIFSHQHKHIKKLFEPCIASLENGNHTNLLNMGVRSQLIKKYNSSVKSNITSKLNQISLPQGEGDDPDSTGIREAVSKKCNLEIERKQRLE